MDSRAPPFSFGWRKRISSFSILLSMKLFRISIGILDTNAITLARFLLGNLTVEVKKSCIFLLAYTWYAFIFSFPAMFRKMLILDLTWLKSEKSNFSFCSSARSCLALRNISSSTFVCLYLHSSLFLHLSLNQHLLLNFWAGRENFLSLSD